MIGCTGTGRRAGDNWPFLMLSVGFVMCAGTVVAMTDEEAIAVCTSEMVEAHSATAVSDLDVRRPEDSPYVYGTADFEDIKGITFRCDMFKGEVNDVEYLVKDPDYVDATKWVAERPRGAAVVTPDKPAASTPVPVAPSPQFQKAPQKP